VAPATAPAALRHTTIVDAFGTDGTNGTGWNVRTFGFDQDDQIFYGIVPSEVHGLEIEAPTVQIPLGPPFPFPAVNVNSNNSAMDVDNSGGPRDGYIYVAQGNGALVRGYTDQGEPLANFPINNEGFACGVSVDDEGFLWVSNREAESIEKYDPATGALSGSIGVSATGPPCSIEFDENGDLYVATFLGPVWRYTKASGYSEFEQMAPAVGFGERINVDSSRHILYVSRSPGIEAIDTETDEVLEFITESNNNAGGVQVDESSNTLYQWNGNGGYVVEIPASEVPRAVTGPPVGDAEVSATVDADGAGAITECFFDVGMDTSYELPDVPCSPGPPYPPNATVTAALPGLTKEITYHYRVVAKNANVGGVGRGLDRTITPHYVTFLRTQGATEVTRTSAKLNAAFEGSGTEVKYYFEWGTDTEYGNVSAAPPGSVLPSPSGNMPLSFTAGTLSAGTTYHFRIVAENSEGKISKGDDETFTTLPAVANVTTDPATAVTTSSATLNGGFDIDAAGGDTSYYFEYGLTEAYGSRTATPPGTPVGNAPGHMSVGKTIEVNDGTTYHYRIVVTNSLGTTVGQDRSFKTPQAPSVDSATSANVTATTADLIAQINPNGFETRYRFEYGTTPAYDHFAPAALTSIGSGESDVQVTQHLEGLEVGATYHFRVVAENDWGDAASPDQTFSFFTPDCPNAHVRQQSGAAYLPDCRAYELVSPENAGPVQLFPGIGLGPVVQEFIPHPQPSNTGFATNPARFAFWGGIGQITGTNPPNITQDMYVSTRTEGGWETHYPGMSASDSFASGTTSCSDLMDRCINYDIADPLELSAEDTGSNAPHVFDSEGNSLEIGRFPTMVEEVPGGEEFTGEGIPSGDYSHYAFSSNDVQFAPGGLEAAPGSAYDNHTAANSAQVISIAEGGGNIAQDPEGCTTETGRERQCSMEVIRIQGVSTDGSHILMSNWAPPLSGEFGEIGFVGLVDRFKRRDVHLTMRVGDAASYDITKGHRAEYVGMTRNGSRVYFTSDEQVTPDDEDGSVDLFMWTESSSAVTRVSAGNGESGNSDSCESEWTKSGTCDVQTPDAVIETPGEPGELFTPDSWIAQNGDVYFYSPEQLDGARGFANARNLYVYRQGQARFVAALDPAGPALRMQVTPDGSRVALLTSSQLTGYDNVGTRQMYTYDPANERLTCVSCVPTGATPVGSAEASQNGLFMSDDGRTFFTTKDALVPYDTDGLRSVYEYVGGRPQLIGSGTSNQDTWPGGLLIYPTMHIGLESVSADGVDVYFSTFDTLVPQDGNGEFIKFYDARTGGGFPFSPPPPLCKAADECHGQGSVPPPAPRVGTGAQLRNTGNARKPKKCRKGFKKKKGKCVKKRKKKRSSRHRGGRRHHG
jgi:hypothetical protein